MVFETESTSAPRPGLPVRKTRRPIVTKLLHDVKHQEYMHHVMAATMDKNLLAAVKDEECSGCSHGQKI